MRLLAVLSLLLIVSSVFVVAAEADATSVAAAVGTAIGTEPSPAASASPGFIDSRLDDIKKRTEPIRRGFEPKDGPQGPRPIYGPNNGGGRGGYIERNGGPDYSERDSIGPRGANDRDLDQYPDFGPSDEGRPGYGGGPGPYGGPQDGQQYGPPQSGYSPGPRDGFRDFRGYGGFDLPPEAIEHMIFNEISDTMEEKYGKDKLMAQCNNQPALVTLVFDEFQKTGINLEQEICSEIEEGLSFCAEAKDQCEQIGNPQFGPQFGDEEKPFVPTCPPDENQWKLMCVERMKSEFERMSGERGEEIESRCREEWDYRPPMEEACRDGKPRQNDMCDKSSWISQCVQNQPPQGDYGGPKNQPYGQPPSGQPYGQPGQPSYGPQPTYSQPTQPQCPPIDENAKQQCINAGQAWMTESVANGCPYVKCIAPNQPPATTTCPALDAQHKESCTQSGGTVSVIADSRGCSYYQCQMPTATTQPTTTVAPTTQATAQPTSQPTVAPTTQPTVQSTPAPTTQPTAAPSVTTAGINEWRLEEGGFGGPQGGYPGGPQGGYGGGPGPYNGPQGKYQQGQGSGGYGQPGGQQPLSASQRCEQEWSRNEARFTQQCQRDQQRNKGPMFNFCNEQEFIAQCKAESQKRMEQDKQRMDPERICAQQVQRDLKHFSRYCKDTSRGKDQCIKESEKGCEFGKKQLAKCKELVQPDNIKKAIERAVARECRARSGPSSGPSRYDKLNDYVSDDYKPVIDFVSDDLTQSDETLSEAERKERDLLYQLFRTNKDNLEQAKKFKESKEKLDQSIKNLKSLRESVNEDKRALFDEEIANIEKRRDEAEQSAKALETGSEGILSFLTKLFGGG